MPIMKQTTGFEVTGFKVVVIEILFTGDYVFTDDFNDDKSGLCISCLKAKLTQWNHVLSVSGLIN
jgi:hypothetical protein